MNIFLEPHQNILKLLNRNSVDYILVGGYAVNFHGYQRTTGDMDLWIRPDNENKKSLLDAMQNLGYDDEGIAIINEWNFEKPQLFSIMKPPFQVEFMTFISGLKYHEAFEQRISTEIDGIPIQVIHLNNLITNKKISGRGKDLIDVEYLLKIKNRRERK